MHTGEKTGCVKRWICGPINTSPFFLRHPVYLITFALLHTNAHLKLSASSLTGLGVWAKCNFYSTDEVACWPKVVAHSLFALTINLFICFKNLKIIFQLIRFNAKNFWSWFTVETNVGHNFRKLKSFKILKSSSTLYSLDTYLPLDTNAKLATQLTKQCI